MSFLGSVHSLLAGIVRAHVGPHAVFGTGKQGLADRSRLSRRSLGFWLGVEQITCFFPGVRTGLFNTKLGYKMIKMFQFGNRLLDK